MPRVIVAPDKFKGSLSAADVARHLARGFERAGLDVECVPVADGGDGTVAALATAGYAIRVAAVTGPLGERVLARWARGDVGFTDAPTGQPVVEATADTAPGDTAWPANGTDAHAAETAAVAKAAGPGNAAGVPQAASPFHADTLSRAAEAVGRRPPGEAGAARSAVGLGPGLGRGSPFPSRVAVVELAQASGLVLSPRPLDALRATSHGTGELLRAARDTHCRRIVLGVGGSACTDGGAGMLQALGVRLLDVDGRDLRPGGAALRDLAAIDPAAVPRDWRDIDLTVACDVDNPLLGPTGAAAVYGPQKGATRSDVATLEAGLSHFAAIVHRDLGMDVAQTPGAGAAGGVAYGALAFLGANLRSGIELVLDLVGFDARLSGADLVVTGEGRLDDQTIRGKAPAGVAAAARRAGIPAVAVAGRSDLDDARLATAGFGAAYRLSDLEPDPAASIRDAAPLLERLAVRVAAEHFPTERSAS